MTSVDNILKALDAFTKTPADIGMDLRLSLAEIVLRKLREKGWNQRALAREAGLKEPFVSRVIHSNANCTFDTAGKLLFALGARARIRETPDVKQAVVGRSTSGEITTLKLIGAETHGQEITCQEQATEHAIIRQA
jgi:ribosome-binding protein aMBF1 (putative translation factor)